MFSRYLFHELLELVDFNLHAAGDQQGCPQFHILPRFVRDLPDHGKEMLSMNQVLMYLIQQNQSVIDETELGYQLKLPQVLTNAICPYKILFATYCFNSYDELPLI